MELINWPTWNRNGLSWDHRYFVSTSSRPSFGSGSQIRKSTGLASCWPCWGSWRSAVGIFSVLIAGASSTAVYARWGGWIQSGSPSRGLSRWYCPQQTGWGFAPKLASLERHYELSDCWGESANLSHQCRRCVLYSWPSHCKRCRHRQRPGTCLQRS